MQQSINNLLQTRTAFVVLVIMFAVGMAFLAPAALAQEGPDISAATDAFAAVSTAVTAIGGAMVTAAGAGIVWRWVTAFLVK